MTSRGKFFGIATAAAMFALLLLVVFGDNGFLEYSRLQATHSRLCESNERLTQENLRLFNIIERLQKDPAFMEYTAHQELGMIRSDELIFKFKGDENKH